MTNDAARAALSALADRPGSPVHRLEVEAFERRLAQLDDARGTLVRGDELEPVDDLPHLVDLPEPTPEAARAALGRLAVVKLNGGLGTSMGLDAPKSLLEIKPGTSFLDAAATQTLVLRARYGIEVPLVLMNSAATREASLAALRRYPGLERDDVPLDFLQGLQPKLRADDRRPVSWPADPRLEWCPPGHGDLYTALAASGTRDALLDAGISWCFVSNADNLGAVPDARIAAWMAAQHVPFALEVVRGTPMDRKGGHLARRDGRLLLRESSQVPEGDDSFGDIARWGFFNTNNLWFDLKALRDLQERADPGPALPLIVNRKTVDPADLNSTSVLQLESAMGAAVSDVPGARALAVPRHRFAPVKTTEDLLIARSDIYELSAEGAMVPNFEEQAPVVNLSKEHFGLLRDFDSRFGRGVPSLRNCVRLDVEGDVTFGTDVTITGRVRLEGPAHVPDGARLGS